MGFLVDCESAVAAAVVVMQSYLSLVGYLMIKRSEKLSMTRHPKVESD